MDLKLKPPTYRIDATAVWIAPTDPAWDKDKIVADRKLFLDKELSAAKRAALEKYQVANRGRELSAEEIEAVTSAVLVDDDMVFRARMRSPLGRYQTGKTRFCLTAPDWDGNGAPCTVKDFLKPGSSPIEFTIKRLSFRDYQRAEELRGSDLGYRPRCLTEFCRLGLRAIKSPDWTWQAERDGYATDEVLEALHEGDVSLPPAIGLAVINLCRPLDTEETLT